MNISKILFFLIGLLSVSWQASALAEGMTFAIVAKSIDDGNFVDAWKGCDEAAKQSGDHCVLLGGSGPAQLRLQANAIREAVKNQHFDGFAVSVISSDLVAEAFQDVTVPIITFDSPFDAYHRHLSRAYVGPDNMEFGRDLARLAKQLHSGGASVCLMTVAHDSNLSLRVLGVRRELSEDSTFPDGKRLEGENGWTESSRCPWNASDNTRKSLNQLGYSLKYIKPDIFLSMGHWPTIDMPLYRKTVEPYRKEILANKRIIIFGIGTQSLTALEALMNDGLASGFVGIDFPEIGRKCYEVMRRIAEGKTVDEVNYIPNIIGVRK